MCSDFNIDCLADGCRPHPMSEVAGGAAQADRRAVAFHQRQQLHRGGVRLRFAALPFLYRLLLTLRYSANTG